MTFKEAKERLERLETISGDVVLCDDDLDAISLAKEALDYVIKRDDPNKTPDSELLDMAKSSMFVSACRIYSEEHGVSLGDAKNYIYNLLEKNKQK